MKTVVTIPKQNTYFPIEKKKFFFHMKPDICYKFSWVVTNTRNMISCEAEDTRWVRSGGPLAMMMHERSKEGFTRSALKLGTAMKHQDDTVLK